MMLLIMMMTMVVVVMMMLINDDDDEEDGEVVVLMCENGEGSFHANVQVGSGKQPEIFWTDLIQSPQMLQFKVHETKIALRFLHPCGVLKLASFFGS